MKLLSTLFWLTFLSTFVRGQEICNDHIDNNNNGLVDCEDPACTPCTAFSECVTQPLQIFVSTGTGRNFTGTQNLALSDNVRMSVLDLLSTNTTNFQSRIFTFTGMGLDIPQNATIRGVKISIERFAEFGNTIYDSQVQLSSRGTLIGNNYAAGTSRFWKDSV